MIQFLASCLIGFGAIVATITLGVVSLPVMIGCVVAGFILGFPIAWLVTKQIIDSRS